MSKLMTAQSAATETSKKIMSFKLHLITRRNTEKYSTLELMK
jgi:hypothetical protein